MADMVQKLEDVPQVFTTPAHAPAYPPPPYEYRNDRIVTILFKTDPAVLKELVPAPLRPNPDALASIYYASLNIVAPMEFSYKETAVLVPVMHGDTAGMFTVYMFLDPATGVLPGREIYGFPKKEADISWDEAEGSLSTVVNHLSGPVMKASMRLAAKVDPVPEEPPRTWFNLKVIPSIREGAPPEVLQLTATRTPARTIEMHQGPATLEFFNSPYDRLGDIPILGIVGAQYVVNDMTLGYGEVVVDYLAGRQKGVAAPTVLQPA